MATKMDWYDERISKLPKWAQEMIEAGAKAGQRSAYWQDKLREAEEKIVDMEREHARTHGAETYDTWISKGDLDVTGEEIRFGLGVNQRVEFGDPSDEVGEFSVSYRDGGIDINSSGGDLVLKPKRYGTPLLRIEIA